MHSTAVAGAEIEAAPVGAGAAELDADAWHEALKMLAGAARFDAGMASEAVRRCRAGLLKARDLRLVLLATGDVPQWAPARRAVIEQVAGRPEMALQILATHAQVEVWPPPRFEAPDPVPPTAGSHVMFAAVVGPADTPVAGPVRRAATARDAKALAALALLACLAGVAAPGQEHPADGRPVERLVLPGMVSEVFDQRLRAAVVAGQGPGAELEEEVTRRARTGRLRHRDMHLLLLSARGTAWTPVREAALDRAAAMPPAPAQLLHWHAAEQGAEQGLSYEEEPVTVQGRHQVRARLEAGGTWTGPVRSAWSRRTARHYAACALLAQVAGLPEPPVPVEDKPAGTVRIAIPAQDQNPLNVLNKHHQLETITKPEVRLRPMGLLVECTCSCRHRATGTQVTATATGPDKAAARRAAALKLLHKLSTLDAAAPTTAAPVRPAGQRDQSAQAVPVARVLAGMRVRRRPTLEAGEGGPHAVLGRAVEAGCAMVFVHAGAGRAAAWWVADTGSLALPMTGLPAPLAAGVLPDGAAGWWVPLLDGVPVLRRAGADAGAPVVFWQRAAHLALQLVRAQLVYPGLDSQDRPVWRVGPVPASAREALTALADAAPAAALPPGCAAGEALVGFCDALADALVRTPAAAMFGAGAWTAPSEQALDPVDSGVLHGARGWLDSVEDLVDGGPAPHLVLRVRPPGGEQAAAGRLTADLHLALPGAFSGAGQEVAAGQVWSGAARLAGDGAEQVRPRVRRVLRRAARLCPALAELAGQDNPQRCTLHADAIEALLAQESELAQAGVQVLWPERLRTALQAETVIGTRPGDHDRPATGRDGAVAWPRFSVTALLDFRWQLALDGAPLSEQEMDALAEAARPLVRIRDQWVLADPVLRRRARHRLLGTLPGVQALTAALAGTVTVDDERVPARAAGTLADTIGVLRRGEHHQDPVPVPAGLAATLRAYQHRALTWLAHTTGLGFGALLCDDMGLGKTLTALAFTLHHQQRVPGPTLVTCPASLVTTWCREAARFAPGLPVIAYRGPERTLDGLTDTTLVITTYGVLRRDHAHLADQHWALVIADEAQFAKNYASATARHLRALPCADRLALTGTPVENDLSELWTLLDWTNPTLFGTLKEFRARWGSAAEKDPDGPAAAELGQVISPFLLRRRKSDPGIAPELPDKIDRPRVVQLTAEQAGLYEAVVRETLQQITEARGTARRGGLVFKLITALKQITNHPAHYLREPPPTAAETAAFIARSAKTAALAELLETIRDREEATLIFTSYVAMGRILTALLTQLGIDPLFLHGGTRDADRQNMIDAFQDGRHPVMILSLKAAGTGLTLTRAAHVVHFDRSWNAAVEDQATDRAHRIGQHRTVTVHRLITAHTIEDRIDELLTHKRALASVVPTGGDHALAQLSDQQLADLVTLGGRR